MRFILLPVIIPPHQQSLTYRLPPPTPSADSIAPFLLGKIIISKLLSEQTVYPVILRHHHSLYSPTHQQMKSILPVKKGYLIIPCYPTPSADPSLQFILPPHQQILLYRFC